MKSTQIIPKSGRLILIMGISLLLFFKPAQAQVNISFNIGIQPLWGPVSYDYVEYYYLPEIDAYYYVPNQQFIYFNAGQWMFATHLPGMYHVDLYNTYKVVVNEPRPYMHHEIYVKKYGKYKSAKSKQLVIRDSRDEKYYVVKGHPRHGKVKAVKSRASESGGRPGRVGSGAIESGNSRPSHVKSSAQKQSHSKQGGEKGNKPQGHGGKKK